MTERERRDRAAWGKAVMILNIALVGLATIVVLTRVGDKDVPDAAAVAPPSGGASTVATPDGVGPDASSPDPTEPSPASETTDEQQAPRVAPAMRANFAAGDAWPYAAGFREAGDRAWPLGIVDGVMTHGPAREPNAVSWLERHTTTDVRTIGARVLFGAKRPGAAILTAWHSSVLELSGQQQPRTGMRLLVLPGQWRLIAIEKSGKAMLASGTYEQRGLSARFNLVRRGATVWVVDPRGHTTSVTDDRVRSLSGPWASWELRESAPGKVPAAFQEIWAG